ncbi:MAG: sensor histidine kinase [Bdellovibrionota bacterium]
MLAANIGLQARAPVRLLPLTAMAALFLFALLHSVFEWIRLLQFVETIGITDTTPLTLDVAGVLCLPLSLFFLAAFGFEIMVGSNYWPKWTRVIYLAVGLAWAIFTLAWVSPDFSRLDGWAPQLEKLARASICFPAALLSAYALWQFEKRQDSRLTKRSRTMLRGSAAAMLVYGIAAGLTFFIPTIRVTHPFTPVPQPPLGLAITLTIFRAAAAVALSAFLTETFVIEIARIQEESSKLRQEFVSAIGHDLRGAISRIDLSAQLLLRLIQQGRQPERQRELTENIRTTVRLLVAMVSDFFDLSLIDISRIELHKKPTDLGNLVSKTAKQMELISGRTIQFEPPAAPINANIDEARLSQVLDNLLSNATKYSAPDTEIECAMLPERQGIKISVASHGQPIPPEQLAHLFDRFYRATRKSGGTGLGLHIVKGLVAAHGGKVEVSSSESGLTVFNVWLPA